jgi:AraC-like DNA-binding protein
LPDGRATRDTLRAAVEARMRAHLREGTPSTDRIARDLGMSRQTLYRRLEDEGATFAQVHDDLRRRMAMDCLSAGRASAGETAYLPGFSEASAFLARLPALDRGEPDGLPGAGPND